ncbi:helix-turn-helix domain-containing protein [Streptomyces sp. KN37]|uniref:helix-turn-helix domain-containing protein n=1 Tax=Streptomyces sp. KN37 TaxID=3090667 RepID=UPI0039BE26EA
MARGVRSSWAALAVNRRWDCTSGTDNGPRPGGGVENQDHHTNPALRSAGPANSATVTAAQFAVLEEELGKGPPAHGFDDERWTLAQVQTVIRRRWKLSLSVATVWRLLQRHGWSWQAPPAEHLNVMSTPSNCGRRRCGRG